MSAFPLTNSSALFVVDDADDALVVGRSWGVTAKGYVRSNEHRAIYLHRALVNPGRGLVVDHRNRDVFDNRRANLRICTFAENTRNRKMPRTNALGVRGVYQNKGDPKSPYRAQVCHDGIKHRRSFATLEEAALWVRETAARLHGDFFCADGCLS